MNPEKTPELTVQTLMALRKETDAVRVITDRLKVKEMGPADHIRTKHEVKAFIETAGGLKEAEAIIARSHARRTLHETQSIKVKMTERQDERCSRSRTV